MKTRTLLLLIPTALASFGSGEPEGRHSLQGKKGPAPAEVPSNTGKGLKWPEEFRVVQIQSTLDSAKQPAYFFKASSTERRPLVVSLHTWTGDYKQEDPLAAKAKANRWNYIHPDFRGPNRTRDACLSEKALADIDDAIQYAIDNSMVDTRNIFVVGVSGGGYATLGAYLKTRHQVRAFLSWAPISDLVSWYEQSRQRRLRYAEDILECTSNGQGLNVEEAARRSPLFWDIPEHRKGRLELYAGINDGYTGSVPISHSIVFFNKMVRHTGDVQKLVGQEDMIQLLSRGMRPEEPVTKIEGRAVFYHRSSDGVSLTIFDGGHEMLADYCFKRMMELAEQGAAPGK